MYIYTFTTLINISGEKPVILRHSFIAHPEMEAIAIKEKQLRTIEH